jgi:hypothetical protein
MNEFLYVKRQSANWLLPYKVPTDYWLLPYIVPTDYYRKEGQLTTTVQSAKWLLPYRVPNDYYRTKCQLTTTVKRANWQLPYKVPTDCYRTKCQLTATVHSANWLLPYKVPTTVQSAKTRKNWYLCSCCVTLAYTAVRRKVSTVCQDDYWNHWAKDMHIKDRWKVWRHMASLGWKGLRLRLDKFAKCNSTSPDPYNHFCGWKASLCCNMDTS